MPPCDAYFKTLGFQQFIKVIKERWQSMFDLWLVCMMLVIASPLLISTLPKGSLDARSLSITAIIGAVALAVPLLGFGDTANVWRFLFFQTMLFFAFVSVSRMRQRKSAFLHALASIPSNGVWFITMFALAGAYVEAKDVLSSSALTYEFIGLFVAAIAGSAIGRLTGVQWMQWVERKWEVRTDSVGSEALKKLDKHTPTTLVTSMVFCLWVYWLFEFAPFVDVLIVTMLGLAQSGVYAINTRLANRNHPGWPVITGLIGGAVFIVHWAYLIGYTQAGGFMPLALLVPYTAATISGSVVGASISSMIESAKRIVADAHVHGKDEYAGITWHRYVLFGTAALCAVFLVTSESVLPALGLAVNEIALPFPVADYVIKGVVMRIYDLLLFLLTWHQIPTDNVVLFFSPLAKIDWVRPIALVFGGIMFFVQNATHTLSSRAGNRNHAPYHATTCVLHGTLYFFTSSFVILNASFVDLIPVAMLGGALGQLFAMRLSLRLEKSLASVMDVPETAPAK